MHGSVERARPVRRCGGRAVAETRAGLSLCGCRLRRFARYGAAGRGGDPRDAHAARSPFCLSFGGGDEGRRRELRRQFRRYRDRIQCVERHGGDRQNDRRRPFGAGGTAAGRPDRGDRRAAGRRAEPGRGAQTIARPVGHAGEVGGVAPCREGAAGVYRDARRYSAPYGRRGLQGRCGDGVYQGEPFRADDDAGVRRGVQGDEGRAFADPRSAGQRRRPARSGGRYGQLLPAARQPDRLDRGARGAAPRLYGAGRRRFSPRAGRGAH